MRSEAGAELARSALDKNIESINGACHCGTVRFHVRLSDGLHTARRCTCSYCTMRGAVAISAKVGDLDILSGAEALTLYQFNTMTAKHYFCSRCGIYTHHQRRSDPSEYGVNVACLSGLSPFDFDEIPVQDGKSHRSDAPAMPHSTVAGVLRFIPAE